MLIALPFVAALLVASAPMPKLKEGAPGLKAQASIAYEVALKTARAKMPAAKVVEAELENEHGKLVYSFDMRTPGKSGIDEVQVDAKSGEIVSVEHEGPEAEAKEKAADAQEPAKQ